MILIFNPLKPTGYVMHQQFNLLKLTGYVMHLQFNLLKPTGYVMHQQFNLLKPTGYVMYQQFNLLKPTGYVMYQQFNPLKPTGYVMHQQFNLLKPTGCVMHQQFIFSVFKYRLMFLYFPPTPSQCIWFLQINCHRRHRPNANMFNWGWTLLNYLKLPNIMFQIIRAIYMGNIYLTVLDCSDYELP